VPTPRASVRYHALRRYKKIFSQVARYSQPSQRLDDAIGGFHAAARQFDNLGARCLAPPPGECQHSLLSCVDRDRDCRMSFLVPPPRKTGAVFINDRIAIVILPNVLGYRHRLHCKCRRKIAFYLVRRGQSEN
jgi:hypothetical protein